MANCKHLNVCKFYNKYKNALDANCRIYIAKYCHGCGELNCKRLEFRISNGYSAVDNYTPEGGVLILLDEEVLV
ncbi:hypothetical protein LX69_02170 [Breznakibacter xylanolyticus]|uniref:Uncharacterized protein n=1 Tax=Breznakibacter xylanolyticus TaxID=990 RepID=A0A2W7N6J6_9BACT|nr:hypothetical protein [Breznakibacter xylanolyticus]MBN2742994.1 hypothetical protein [Marinilabiliaceae bacterium]PZX15333.1 hypothetical protein LX69_02170 [Breznakibacter xylanolyticus]